MLLDIATFSPDPQLPIAGVAAAMLVPRSQDGNLDLNQFGRHLDFLQDRGIRSFALNGATGEYTITNESEFARIAELGRSRLGAESRLILGIGGPDTHSVRKLARLATGAGADGLLLPMPYFFPYGQDDLKAFVREIAPALELATYLYNLPAFTTPLEPATTVELIGTCKHLVGTKDSSGRLDTLRLLRKKQAGGCILGNDGALYAGLAEKVCDGVVSGVACVLPELMLALYRSTSADPQGERSLHLKDKLQEFISWLDRFPVPWGLKIVAEARGLGTASFPLPLSAEKAAAREEFLRWFSAHRNELLVSTD